MIQSTFLGSPPRSLSRVMHWPRWCCECIATCTRASRDRDHTGRIRKPGDPNGAGQFFRGHGSRQMHADRRGRFARESSVRRRRPAGPGLGPPGSSRSEHRHETLLHSDQMGSCGGAVLRGLVRAKIAPGVEKHRVGPFGVGHQVAEQMKHWKKLLRAVMARLKASRSSARITTDQMLMIPQRSGSGHCA